MQKKMPLILVGFDLEGRHARRTRNMQGLEISHVNTMY